MSGPPKIPRLTLAQKRALNALPLYRRRGGYGKPGVKISIATAQRLMALGLAEKSGAMLRARSGSSLPPSLPSRPPRGEGFPSRDRLDVPALWWMRD